MMKKISVIFVGTGAFGNCVLEELLKDKRATIPSVITAPDKPVGRYLKITTSTIKNIALANKLIIQQPKRIAELKQNLIQTAPDFLLVVAYGEILPKEILSIPTIGAINIHASLLPKYRGASPIQETLLHGDNETGITWILMNEKMDAGMIIAQKIIGISPNDNFHTLSEKLARCAAQYTVDALLDFAENKTSRQQDETKASYCRKIKKEDGFINVYSKTAEQIMRKIRAYSDWPGCSILWNNKRLKIVQAEVSEQKISPGEMKALDNGLLAIGTQKGALLPTRVQLESKREMDIKEFLRGQREIPKEIKLENF